MSTTEDQTVAAGHSVTPARWQTGLDELLGRVAGRFGRVEPRRHARAFVLGLLADLPRKNCWTIAEHAGQATPDGLQHLLAGAVWDERAVRDDVRDYLVEHLADPAAVLVVDETGDLKKGTATVGVQRQYTGTAGKIDNAQVAVYLTYATTAGHGVIDRELYLPQGWLADAERCRAAEVPTPRAFATKPELAKMMLQRALDAGVPAGWVTADEVDGGSPALRGWLEGRQLPYVLAVKCTEPLPPPCGPPTPAARLAQLRPFWDRPLLTVSDRQMPMLRARRGHGQRGRHSLQRCSNGHQFHGRVGQSWTTAASWATLRRRGARSVLGQGDGDFTSVVRAGHLVMVGSAGWRVTELLERVDRFLCFIPSARDRRP